MKGKHYGSLFVYKLQKMLKDIPNHPKKISNNLKSFANQYILKMISFHAGKKTGKKCIKYSYLKILLKLH